ncbi:MULTISPECIES: hypothetical protein [Streptomyces]|uniref:WXG100 family type VII secretion target n=1 Tax=Streptomyces ramulosus TaxID=47762 RepID=A0ABW1FH13_9ACTN
MADLVVKDLKELADGLNKLVEDFKAATDFQDHSRDLWGQHNANESMKDFAYNWKVHRSDMADKMSSFSEKVAKIDEEWTKADEKMKKSLKTS